MKQAEQAYNEAKTRLTPAHDQYVKDVRAALDQNNESEVQRIEEVWAEQQDQILSFQIFCRNGIGDTLPEAAMLAVSNGIRYWDDEIFANTLEA